jgi:hypothetical protein
VSLTISDAPVEVEQTLDPRAEFVNGLRALADFIAAHPEVPTPKYPRVLCVLPDGDDAEAAQLVAVAAAAMGVPVRVPFPDAPKPQLWADGQFGPEYVGVGYSVHAIVSGRPPHRELVEAAALAADAAQVLATLAEPVAVVTAALTSDDPSLPAEVAAPRSWSAGEVIDADVDEVTDQSGDTWRRTKDGLWVLCNGAVGHTPWSERIVQLHWGPLTEVLAGVAR